MNLKPEAQRYLPLVQTIATQILMCFQQPPRLEFLIKAGIEGLVSAQEAFQTRQGTTFQTFAEYRIRKSIYKALRENGMLSPSDANNMFRQKANDWMQSYVSSADATLKRELAAEAAELQNVLENQVIIYLMCSPESFGKLQLLLKAYSETEQSLIESYYAEGKEMEEVAKQLSVAYPTAVRIHTNLVKKIRMALKSG